MLHQFFICSLFIFQAPYAVPLSTRISDSFLQANDDCIAFLLADAFLQIRFDGWPSMVPRTLTKPRVPKNSAEPGITT
jgi:hypothetical protein